MKVENLVNLWRSEWIPNFVATFVSLSIPMPICFRIILSSSCFAPLLQQGSVQIHGKKTVLPISIHITFLSFGSIDASLWQDAGHVVKSTSVGERFLRKGPPRLDTSMASFKMLTPLSHSSSLTSRMQKRIALNKQFMKLQLQDLNRAMNCSPKSAAAKWTNQMYQIQVFRSNQMGQVNATQLTSAG